MLINFYKILRTPLGGTRALIRVMKPPLSPQHVGVSDHESVFYGFLVFGKKEDIVWMR